MKYIIEIPDDAQYILINGASENHCYTRVEQVEDLEELNSDYINEHYGGLQDDAYNRGLENAWNVARKLVVETDDGGVSISDLYKIFGTESMCTIMKNNTVYDAIDKLKAYEDKQKDDDSIEAGDIVDRYIDGKFDSRGIYLGGNDKIWDCLFWGNTLPITLAYPKEQFKKTGKHYDIQSILEAMRK